MRIIAQFGKRMMDRGSGGIKTTIMKNDWIISFFGPNIFISLVLRGPFTYDCGLYFCPQE
jgi:hypothetical protein